MPRYNYPPGSTMRCDYCLAEGKGEKWILISKKEEHEKLVHLIGATPEPATESVVQFYSEHAQKLLRPQQLKVLKFLEHECIVYEGGSVYVCKPIPDYNKTTYRISKDPQGELICTCQYYQMNKLMCSHIGALYEFWARQPKQKVLA